jgi:choline transport protein
MCSQYAGVDGATHMAEEIENASVAIPRALIITVAVNGVFGWAMLILVFFCMGSVEEILGAEGGFSFVSLFYSITKSVPGTSVLVSIAPSYLFMLIRTEIC